MGRQGELGDMATEDTLGTKRLDLSERAIPIAIGRRADLSKEKSL